MVVVMKSNATDEDIDRVVDKVREAAGEAFVSRGKTRTIIGLVGDTGAFMALPLETLPGVENVIQVGKPYKLVARESHPHPSMVKIGPAAVGREQFSVIAGPCAIESADQSLGAARAAKAAGATILRGDAYKARTSPYSFQGTTKIGLEILAACRAETGLPVVTEVMDARDLSAVLEVADVLQVGARNMQNYPLLTEIGRSGRPVLLKRGLSATLEELLMAAEYILKEGNERVLLCERGIRTFETAYRFTLDLTAIPVLKELSHLPVIVDPSHAAGDRRLVEPLSRAAAAVGADGIIVEVAEDPEAALCDGPQALQPHELQSLTAELAALAQALGRPLA